jgi:hypothetical protein
VSLLEAGHVRVCAGCSGLSVEVAFLPKPPPNWPTIVSDVGMEFLVESGRVKDRLFVKLMRRSCPVGTVITTGDQPADDGFSFEQLAVEPAIVVPQEYPHIGTDEPSGIVIEVGPAVRFTCCCATAQLASRRRIHTASNTVLTTILELITRMSVSSVSSNNLVGLVDQELPGIH